jgi:hypothetical protein
VRVAGVRLAVYGGESADLPPQLLQGFLNSVTAGNAAARIGHVYPFEEIVQAHKDMEGRTVSRKLVVTT